MPNEIEELKDALANFRLAVIEALSAINVEIDVLQGAVKEQTPVTAARLKQLREKSQKILHQFRKKYSQHIPLAHQRL
jgi:hypothetical protein